MSSSNSSCSNIELGEAEKKLSVQACNILNDLRKNAQLCDAVIKCEDGQFPVHRAIMCACSPYFRALFTNGLNETDHREVYLRGVNADMMAYIIEHAYTRTVEVDTENVERLLIAADQFHVIGLIKQCTVFLGSQLSCTNCIGIGNLAKAYFCRHLERLANNFILDHFCDIAIQSNEILGLTKEELITILDSDDLNVKNEETVFELVVRWVKHDEAGRLDCMQDLMKCSRLGLLNTPYFVDNVKSHPYVKGNEACRPLVIEALKFHYDLEANDNEVDFTHPLARPRIPHEVIFAVGGWSGGSPTDVVESYDTRADRWSIAESIDAGSRAYHGCATVDNKVYIVGGFDGLEYYNTCRCYDLISKEWGEISSMNAKRCYVSVAVLNSHIYAMGGFDALVRQNTAERYNPATNQWSLIAPMNHQRSDASACSAGERVYICGGFNGQECLDSAEEYDPAVNQWSMIRNMRNRRSGVGVISLSGLVYAIGGFNGIVRLNNAERYDPETKQWTSVADMCSPRSNFGIEVIDDMVFAIGGFNGISTIFNVECYDPNVDEWYDCKDMSICRSALSCCLVRGLQNVRDYIHRDSAKHSPHHRANPSAAQAAGQEEAVAPPPAAAVAGPVQAPADAHGPQPMEQDENNNDII